MLSLEETKKDVSKIKKDESEEQRQLLEQIKELEQELDTVDTDLAQAEQEYEEVNSSIRKQKIIPDKKTGEDSRLESLRTQADELLNEIATAVRNGQVAPDFEIYRDEHFLENVDTDAQRLIEKEQERYNVELDVIDLEGKCRNDNYALDEKDHAIGIKDANIDYQKNHLDALQNELDRANNYYDGIINQVKSKIEEESKDIKDLEYQLKEKKDERERLRKKTESLRADVNMSLSTDLDNGKDLDTEISRKLQEVEEAEKLRKDAQKELDKVYDDWTHKLKSVVDKAYVNSNNGRDQEQLDEIKRLIQENDEVARNVNELFQKKEQIENQLYLQKCKTKLSETFDFDIHRMSESLDRLREEDQLILDELKRAEDSIQTKKHTLTYLDERIENLKEQLEALDNETEERRAHIADLKLQIENTRNEIEQIGANGEDEEAERLKELIAEKEAEIKDLEAKVKQKEAIYDDWRERVSVKQSVIKRRSKSRKREYVPDPTDDADTIIADYVNNTEDPVPVQRLGFRKYLYGTRNIEVREDDKQGPIVIVNDGEAMLLPDFLEYFTEEENKKLANIRDDEELFITEKGDYQYRKSLKGSFNRNSSSYYSSTPQRRQFESKY